MSWICLEGIFFVCGFKGLGVFAVKVAHSYEFWPYHRDRHWWKCQGAGLLLWHPWIPPLSWRCLSGWCDSNGAELGYRWYFASLSCGDPPISSEIALLVIFICINSGSSIRSVNFPAPDVNMRAFVRCRLVCQGRDNPLQSGRVAPPHCLSTRSEASKAFHSC
jgi:hypothetical protein